MSNISFRFPTFTAVFGKIQSLMAKWFPRRRLKRIGGTLVILVAFYTLFGFFGLPAILKSVIALQASKALGRPVTIERVRVNPYALSVTISGLDVREPDGKDKFLSVGEIYVNAKAASIFRLAPILSEIRVESPYIHIVRLDGTRFNFSDLIKPSAPATAPSKPLLFSLNNIQVHDGDIRYSDKLKGKEHALSAIYFAIPSVSNFPYYIETDVQPHFSAKFDGSPIALEGATRPFAESRETTLNLELKELDLPYYLTYMPFNMDYKVLSGVVSVKATLSYMEFKHSPPQMTLWADMSVSRVEVTDKAGKPMVKLPRLAFEGITCRLSASHALCRKVSIEGLDLNVARDASGKINLMSLIPDLPRAPAPAAPKAPETALILDVGEIALTDAAVAFADAVPRTPFSVKLSPINMCVTHFSTAPAPNARAAFMANFDVNDAGSLALKGNFALQPMAASVQLNLKELGLKLAQPYLGEFVKLLITSGSVSMDMKIDVEQGADGQFAINAVGSTSVDKLATVDLHADELVKWDKLALTGIRASMSPLQARIEEIALTGPGANIVMAADGTVNLTDVLVVAPPRAEPTPAPAPVTPATPAAVPAPQTISIGKVTCKDGKVSFTDKTITPNYSLNIAELEGKVEGFSLQGDMVATVNVGARIDQAPLRVTGRLKPVMNDLFADVRVVLSDMNLSPFTPYSDKYVGYPVLKGKLALDLQYLINKRKLESKNSLFTDQFTLGDKVDSPTATKLPVKFALALLTDRRGQIKLDIPVSGSMDDPKFRVLPVVLHVMVNILEKAATSPFALIGSLIGGGEELSFVEFDFGSARVNDPAKKSLDKLIGALADRPALRFEIRPQIATAHDTDAMRKELFDRKLKAQKLKELVKKGQPVVPVDEMTVAPEEYERLLTLAYEEEDMPKPRTFIGTIKKQPRAEMERMLNEHIQVTADDLRVLAYRRAAAVRDYMLGPNSVEAARLFLIEPEVLPPGETADAKAAHVVFNLRAGDSAPSGAQFSAPAEAPERPALPQKRSKLRLLLYGAGGVVVVVGVVLLVH
jgi:hypothetical protein